MDESLDAQLTLAIELDDYRYERRLAMKTEERYFRLKTGKFKGRTLSECPREYVIHLATDMKPKTRERNRAKKAAAAYLRELWSTAR